MKPIRYDLTIEAVLADPVIGAAMRADHVDPRWLEDLLRSTARRIDPAGRPSHLPFAALAEAARHAMAGSCSRW